MADETGTTVAEGAGAQDEAAEAKKWLFVGFRFADAAHPGREFTVRLSDLDATPDAESDHDRFVHSRRVELDWAITRAADFRELVDDQREVVRELFDAVQKVSR